MHKRTARLLIWTALAVYVVLATTGLALQIQTHINYPNMGIPALSIGFLGLLFWFFIGNLIASRHPHHPIGWIFVLTPIPYGLEIFTFGYAYYGEVAYPGSLPGVDLALIWLNWSGSPFGLLAFTFLLLLFPDGRLPSPRWRTIAWAAVGALPVFLLLAALEPGPLTNMPYFRNPIAASDSVWTFLNPLMWGAEAVQTLCMVAAILSLFMRLRRAVGEQRQQLKWFLYAGAFLTFSILLSATYELGPAYRVIWLPGVYLSLLSAIGMAGVTAIAIFKYRLYDIDLIINRTLVYGSLTATLTLVYFMSVVLLQQVFPARSPIAIVLSTLAIFALFSPLRRRLQNAIDKRFYRRKYDAEKTLVAFNAIVREEVDLENISQALLASVGETMQPAYTSLWLRLSRPAGRKQHT